MNNSIAGGSSGTIPISNRTAPSDTEKQNRDACLLPPLDGERSTIVGAAQLRVPVKARREYRRACSDLTKKKPSNAERHLRRAVEEYPRYAAAWVTLGQVLADELKPEDARSACSEAVKMEPIYLPGHLCLAEIASRNQDWSEELQHSSRALELDPSNGVLAYEYHAAANANLGNLAEAEESGLRAIASNKGRRDPGAYFLLAQIYKLKGDTAREEEEFREYLKYTHNPERAAQARQILAKLENGHEIIEIAESETSPDNTRHTAEEWEPANVNKSLPPIMDDVTCPLSQILQGTGQRVTELVESLQRFTATEQIEHTELSKSGERRKSTTERFSYVAEIEEKPTGLFLVNEYRTAKTNTVSPPLTDEGTAALALIFHPRAIENLEIHCAGRTEFQGKSAWQLRFEEKPDRSKSFSAFRIKNSEYRLRLEGQAWISADNYQVMRLETDLASPIPEINLRVEHSDVAYAAVESAGHKFELWLPESALMQIDYRGRRYQRVHRFSHFQLFLVDTHQTVSEPSSQIAKPEAMRN